MCYINDEAVWLVGCCFLLLLLLLLRSSLFRPSGLGPVIKTDRPAMQDGTSFSEDVIASWVIELFDCTAEENISSFCYVKLGHKTRERKRRVGLIGEE